MRRNLTMYFEGMLTEYLYLLNQKLFCLIEYNLIMLFGSYVGYVIVPEKEDSVVQ